MNQVSMTTEATMTIVALVAVNAFGLGWLVSFFLSGLRMKGIVNAMAIFADARNWRIKAEGETLRYVWANVRINPEALARRALE